MLTEELVLFLSLFKYNLLQPIKVCDQFVDLQFLRLLRFSNFDQKLKVGLIIQCECFFLEAHLYAVVSLLGTLLLLLGVLIVG